MTNILFQGTKILVIEDLNLFILKV